MISSEELTKRWNELHETPKKPPTPVVRTESTTPSRQDNDLAQKGLVAAGSGDGTIEKMFKRFKGATKPPEERLRAPIIWIGKLAVGESKDFDGWWDVILPNQAASISFYGPFARQRALAQAEKLKEQYK